MLHEPAAQSGPDHAATYKRSLGVKMLIVYTLVYAGFVAINVMKPLLMEKIVLFGLNLACVYGIGLIVVALVQALIYDALCRRQEAALSRQTGDRI